MRNKWIVVLIALCLSGCGMASTSELVETGTLQEASSTEPIARTEQLPVTPTATATPFPVITPSLTSDLELRGTTYWIDDGVPDHLVEQLQFPPSMIRLAEQENADLRLVILPAAQGVQDNCLEKYIWVYALVAPFPTVDDGVGLEEVTDQWKNGSAKTFGRRPLLMDEETARLLTSVMGEPVNDAIMIVEPENIVDTAWNAKRAWGIVSFEKLEPRWKVLDISGMSPFDRGLDLNQYPLVFLFCWQGNNSNFDAWKNLQSMNEGQVEKTNRDLDRLTILDMTGVTALVRGTAGLMADKGVDYPAEAIMDWLGQADITHMSNEVAFSEDCPPGLPIKTGMSFCSPPEFLELLMDIGVDVVELTGNHINDWGNEAFLFTLDLYQGNGIAVYGGGRNLEEAREPLKVIDHGNKLAFLGCNSAGPEKAWAEEQTPGSAPCDRDWVASEIGELRAEGYLPIVTFQHVEVCNPIPHNTQVADFQAAAQAGAVIVSGSQAHCPQTFAFINASLIHYGLGNLFFDQLDFATRRGFIDRHVFYEGRYLGVDLATTMLEEAGRPRFMENVERRQLLREIFEAGGW